jgi:hypothetical protein
MLLWPHLAGWQRWCRQTAHLEQVRLSRGDSGCWLQQAVVCSGSRAAKGWKSFGGH